MKIFNNIDPKKTNIPNKEDNKSQYEDIKSRSKDLLNIHADNFLDQKQQSQYPDINQISKSPDQLVSEQTFSDADRQQARDQHIEGQAPAENLNDIHGTWLGEVGSGFMRGVGQTISSNGDLANFIGSAIPGITMLEGNILGNTLSNWGNAIEADNRTFLKKKLEGQEITWASMADKDFWSTNVSEMIPLALEFLMTGAAVAGASETGASWFARQAGSKALRAARQTTTGAVEAMAGLGEVATDVLGSGKGLTKYLLKNVNGVGELTELSRSAAGTLGAGLANNLMAGAMNGMQLHNQMKEANDALIKQGKEPIYTEDDMAEAATGTVKQNMAYLPIDVMSWGITYGNILEKAYAPISKSFIKSTPELMSQASGGFVKATYPVFKGLAKAAGHGLLEGYEETYQETYENWAALKAKAKITGEDVPDYWDYYNSKDNTATKVLSMAVGGLMGGVTNLRTAFNKNADNGLNYMDRNEMLKASIDAKNKQGKDWQEMHIHNQMLDLHNEGKEELFDSFMKDLVARGTVSAEEVGNYRDIFDKVGEDFAQAKDLNIAGKEALMRNTVSSHFMKDSIENEKATYLEKKKEIESNFEPGKERDAMVQKLTDDTNESLKTKSILTAKYEQNRLNLISGKLADPVSMQFVVSRNGQERIMMPEFMTDLGFETELQQAGIVAGLSDEQYNQYILKSDEQIYADARKGNARAVSSLNSKARDIYDSMISTNQVATEEETESESNNDQQSQEIANTIEEKKPTIVTNLSSGENLRTPSNLDEISYDVKDFKNGKRGVGFEVKPLNKKGNDLGYLMITDDATIGDTKWKVDHSGLNEETLKKTGLGYDMYRKMVDEAVKRNISIQSDYHSLSPAAEKVWERLVADGLAVKTGERTNLDIEDKPYTFGRYRTLTGPEQQQSVEKKPKKEKRSVGNESDFERDAIDQEEPPVKRKTLRELEQEAIAEQESNLIKQIDQEIKTDENTQEKESVYEPVANGNIFNVIDQGGKYLKTQAGEIRNFATERLAKMAAGKANGKPSLVGIVAGGAAAYFGGKQVVNAVKNKFTPKAELTQEEEIAQEQQAKRNRRAQENATLNYNIIRDNLRRGIISTKQNLHAYTSQEANPSLVGLQNDLDAYLNSSIAAFKYGPTTIQQQITINRNLKQKGIKLEVVAADNLYSAVGVKAVGYAIASTIFIDEDSWKQPEVFMHEMAHINYRVTKDNPETKAVVERSYQNRDLVSRVKKDYAEHLVYDMGEANGVMQRSSLIDIMIGDGQTSYADAMDLIESVGADTILNSLGNPAESAMQYQDTINEELFAFTLEGPLAKTYNQFFEPIKELGRQKVTKSWWSWLKGKSVTYEQSTNDIVTSLNDGDYVSTDELFDHVMKGFEENVAKSTTTTKGFASKVSKMSSQVAKQQRKITEQKLSEQEKYDSVAEKKIDRSSFEQKTLKKIKDEINSNENLTQAQKDRATELAVEDLENNMMEDGAFDDYEMAKAFVFRGATRILNNFTKSLNYVKRQRFLKNPDNIQVAFDENNLVNRDELISHMYNLAFETKGNANDFIQAVEKSDIEEIYMFNQYMDKVYPDKKNMYLNSMAYVMSNNQTISAIKSYVSPDGKYEIENALSETEKNKVDSHLNYLRDLNEQYRANNRRNVNNTPYELFEESYAKLKNNTQTAQDYLNVIRMLSPFGIKYSELLKSNTINIRGTNASVKQLIDNLVSSGIAENKKTGQIYVYGLRPFVEAVVDSNRKFTSYSVVENAEGNFEPSKITNNHLLSQVNDMNEFLANNGRAQMPSFAQFKKRYAHLSFNKNTRENPILKNIYDNFRDGKSVPSVTQYMGLKHQQSGQNSLFKNSTDFTQTVEDFLMFANPNRPNSPEYQQNMGAFADSPRKFLFSAPRLSYANNFTNSTNLNDTGKKQLDNAFKIYEALNSNLSKEEKAGIYKTYSEFEKGFQNEVQAEFDQWNQHGNDLIKNKTLSNYFDPKTGQLSNDGKRKITEYVFNQSVNGLALAEIFNPGVPTKEIAKRNKGNSSPVVSFGNKNLKLEPIPINDSNVKGSTDSGMYMLEEDAKKIVAAGLGVFDLENGLKLMNYSIERDNPNFADRAAYFKGYTTIISDKTLKTEPGLKGVRDLLLARRERYRQNHVSKYGYKPSEDLLDGTPNYLNFAVPYSAIKSDWLTKEQKAKLKNLTYENLQVEYNLDEDISPLQESIHSTLDELYYKDANFMGISSENFGPQQIMDKVTTESTTPVQFISSVIVNGMAQSNLDLGEDIQRLIRSDMQNNLDDTIAELKDMNPTSYKNFILKNLDLENMDQAQRLIIEESLTNLDHTAISDFVTNTLANRLKQAGNKLKTAGTIAQQKPNLFYRLPNGYSIGGSTGLKGYTDRINPDGSVGSNPLEIVLPRSMIGQVDKREYFAIGDSNLETNISIMIKQDFSKLPENEKLNILKQWAGKEALYRFNRNENKNSYGFRVEDHIGTIQKNGKTVGYFTRGKTVLATRIPSHGPASTGVFEVVDFLAEKGNQTIVSNEFSEVVGSDYDGDSLFIQTKSKNTPGFNEALDRTVELWTSPAMHDQIRAKMDFQDKVEKVLKNNKKQSNQGFPMSPRYNREAYNNTMISKRNIGVVFNMHRIANYLAAYNVKLNDPITINGNEITNFKDDKVGVDSRNNNSAMLANIILDNAKYHYADALGLNDQTVNQFTLLTNMGVSLQDANDIMNSEAVQVWNKYKKDNQSPYLSKRKASEINQMISSDLGIGSIKDASYRIDTASDKINTAQQKANIISLMNHLEQMNSDLLKISKVMAGHKGIENNPFILEKQLNDFNEVIDSKQKNPILSFNDDFKNNPDIKAYHDNAEKILNVMKKANKIYRPATSELVENLNKKLGYDGMSENQLERVSDLLNRFVNSRVMGFNNIPAEEKEQIKNDLFTKMNSYYNSLRESIDQNGKTALDKSILFQRAINLYFDRNNKNSYISANPRFFNESLGEEEKKAVQREFIELPQDIKDGFIMLDMMKNGLTGPLSLVNVFDAPLNYDISNRAAADQLTKEDTKISPKVMAELENIIVSNELNSPDSQIPSIQSKEKVESGEILNYIQRHNSALYNSLKTGKPMFFTVNGKAYEFTGISEQEMRVPKSNFRGNTEKVNTDKLIQDRIQLYNKRSGNMQLDAISIPDDKTFSPLKTQKSYKTDNKADHIIEANIIEDQKKKPSGKASKIDYHNYNDISPLTRQEYDRVMEFNSIVSDEQKEGLYNTYLREKEEANLLATKVNQVTVHKMNNDKLKSLYADYAKKDIYAYSIVTTPIIMEITNRASAEQSNITGQFEDGKDIGVVSSWLNNNNIASNHPATQAVIRQVNAEYKSFVKERGNYIKKINVATEALYDQKFGLSQKRILRFFQKAYQTLFADRSDVYEHLYGNLVETNIIKLPGGKERKEFKFKTKEEIEKLKSSGILSDAEYNFYKTFRETTEELKQHDPSSNTRRDYIPHTAMNTFEMFSTRGFLGLLVNSKGSEEALGDVKIYSNQTGVKELISFNDLKNNYNALALTEGKNFTRIREFNALKQKAKKLYKEGLNEDGTPIQFSYMQNATLNDMSPMSRFSNSRSMKAEEMPSMDLNKALVDYVHATLFSNGNGTFKGFKDMMPLIDGILAYNDKNGYKNAYNYTKEVIKEGFIMKKDQDLFGPTTDKIINGLVRGNTFYALGYKGLLVGKGLYAVGNVAIGKYMNIKREGGKAWLSGEQRYWGTDKGYDIDNLGRRKRSQNILRQLGFMEIDLHDDVSIETKSGLDGIFSNLALLPMAITEDWIQKTHMLGLMTEEEFEKFDSDGNYKAGVIPIDQKRILEMEERVKQSHGKGYSPTDQSRIQKYSLGKMFMQFSRHIPSQIRERFAKEDVDVYGNQYIGSLRQMYNSASTMFSNGMTPEKFKQYYKTLKPHEKEALNSAMRGMAMMGLLGFVLATSGDGGSKLSPGSISQGAISDANVHFNMDRMSFKMIPPAVRSSLAITNALFGAGTKEVPQE